MDNISHRWILKTDNINIDYLKKAGDNFYNKSFRYPFILILTTLNI